MNISLYTSTCKRRHEEPMKNMKNMKNPPADAVGRVLRVFQVFHVLHVFHASPMFAHVVERTPGFGSFLPPFDEGNSRPAGWAVSDFIYLSVKVSISRVCQQWPKV